MIDCPDLLTDAQVAELLGPKVTPRKVRTLREKGSIKSFYVGPGCVLIRREDLEEFLATPGGTGGRDAKPTS